MSRKFKVFLDSGANINSTYRTEVELDDIGVSSEEWDAMSDDEKDEVMRPIAFDRSDWGYSEVEEGK